MVAHTHDVMLAEHAKKVNALRVSKDLHNTVNIRHLTHLVALAEHGSFSAAADAMEISQPAMSESIARFETALGVQLAGRGRMGVQMTEAGAYLARCGADILSRIDEAVVTVRNMSDVAQGPVSLGVPPGLSLALSIPLLETIFVERPEIRMSIMEGVSDDVLRWIEDETVDMGCVYDAVETSVYAVEPLMTEEVFLVTALDNWDGEIGPNGVAVDPITPEQLAQLPLVMTGARGGRAIQEIVSRATGSRLNVLATINSLAQIVEMVSRASAYAILSHASIYQQVQDKQLAIVRIEGTPLFHTAYIVRKRSRAVSQNTMILEAYLRSIMSEMVERHDIIGIKVLDSGKTSGQPKQISR